MIMKNTPIQLEFLFLLLLTLFPVLNDLQYGVPFSSVKSPNRNQFNVIFLSSFKWQPNVGTNICFGNAHEKFMLNIL